MPVRKVSNRGGNVIGRFPSLKMQRMIAFESLIERDYLYFLDYERDIDWFEEQPLTIEYLHNGKTLHYTPDFRFVVAEQNTLVECKPYALVNQEDNLRKFAAASSWCANQGWQFRVVTDQDIRTGFRLENIRLLTRHARHTVEPEIKGQICALLYAASKPIPIDTLVNDIKWSIPSTVMAGILHMAFHHELFIPLNDGPISRCTPIGLYPPSHDEVKP